MLHDKLNLFKVDILIDAILIPFPANIYLFKFNNRNTRRRCEVCSKLKIKQPMTFSGVFIVFFENISHLSLVFLLLNMN